MLPLRMVSGTAWAPNAKTVEVFVKHSNISLVEAESKVMKLRSIRTFLNLSPQQQWLLVEAQSLLLMARLMLAFLPFRVLAGWLSRPVQAKQVASTLRLQYIKEVHWAVSICANSGLCNAVCFPQGIAAKIMLNRRGLTPTLYFGVHKDTKERLQAHVWVEDNGVPVIGTSQEVFTVLDTFPQM